MTTDNTGELLMSTARSLRRAFSAALADWDITPSQARALRAVCAAEQMRPSGLAAELKIAPRSATEVIDGLEGYGLVDRAPDPADRRATIVRPTEAGRQLREKIDRVRGNAAAEFLSGLSERDRRTLDRILLTLVDKEC
ncbi:MarR family winged helix-turn-helix transcriptional regulator [Nocardioides sp. LHG3406-4]|uniref:MarR family winged helix-turn-helix transcriptional regulator n=1 Tax=Nocardioides sp. LHG3406-4 TaxID=2804575 RepID=UPI003CF39DB0